jgi:hypothetical protein
MFAGLRGVEMGLLSPSTSLLRYGLHINCAALWAPSPSPVLIFIKGGRAPLNENVRYYRSMLGRSRASTLARTIQQCSHNRSRHSGGSGSPPCRVAMGGTLRAPLACRPVTRGSWYRKTASIAASTKRTKHTALTVQSVSQKKRLHSELGTLAGNWYPEEPSCACNRQAQVARGATCVPSVLLPTR